MNAFLESLTTWLVDFLVLSTALLALSLAARVVVRRPGPRVALAWGTWLGIGLIALAAALPAWPRVALDDLGGRTPEIGGRETEVTQPEANLPPAVMPIDLVAHANPIEVAPVEPPIVSASAPLPIEASSPLPLGQIAVAGWLACTSLGLGWILAGLARTRRMLFGAVKAPQWVHAELVRIVAVRLPPGLWSSERIGTAVALGTLQPQIVLPKASIVESNAPAIRAALAHEWAHIRHGDLWLLALERLLLPLLAVHPLFWWLRRSVRLDQEILADAAAAGEERVEYAEALLAWARSARPSPHGLAAVGLWENPNTLSRRVAMILDAKRPLAGQVSRLWMAAIVLLLAPAVAGLSLVTLRPLAAQDKPAPGEEEIEVAEPEVNPLLRRRYREVGPLPKQAAVPVTKIHLELLVLNVNREKLAAADTTLEDAIAAATESRCRREAGLIVSDVKPQEVVVLLDTLKKHEALEIVSRPQVITLDGREANVQIGGELPILRVEETINGKHEERVEYKEFGTLLMVRPKLSGEKQELVTLELVAEQSRVVPPGKHAEAGAVPRDVPGVVSHKFKLTADVTLGGSLLVAESPAGKKQLRDAVKQQFLVIVTPQRAVREAVAVYADPRAGEEAEARRKASEALLDAVTAAEPEPGTAAAALLQREREARHKETDDLMQRIAHLEAQLTRLRDATGLKVVAREQPIKHQDPVAVAEALGQLVAKSAARHSLAIEKINVGPHRNSIVFQIEEKYAADIQKAIEQLDRSDEDLRGDDPIAQVMRKVLQERPVRMPPASDPTRQIDLRLLELDLEQAKLAYETVAKEFARVEQLRADGAVSQQERDARQVAVAQAQIDVRRAEAKLEAARAVIPSATSTTAAPVSPQHINREALTADVAQARLDLERAEKEFARIVKLKADNGISEAQFDAKQYELERAKIQLRKAEAMLSGVKAQADPQPAARPTPAKSQADVRLLELDLAEAKVVLDVAEAELAQAEEINNKSPNAVSQPELRKYRAAIERAKIQLQRAQIKLEAAKEGAAPQGR